MFFSAVNPMLVDQHKDVEYDLTKLRIALYKKQLNNTSKYSILVQFEGCSREGIAVLSNTIQRNHPSQHFTRGVHREGGEHKVRRRIVQ